MLASQPPRTERSHRGLVRRFAKPLWGNLLRGFESPPLRQSFRRISASCARSSADRASGCGPEGRGFESRRARHLSSRPAHDPTPAQASSAVSSALRRLRTRIGSASWSTSSVRAAGGSASSARDGRGRSQNCGHAAARRRAPARRRTGSRRPCSSGRAARTAAVARATIVAGATRRHRAPRSGPAASRRQPSDANPR